MEKRKLGANLILLIWNQMKFPMRKGIHGGRIKDGESPLKSWSFHKKMDEAMGNVDQTSASESMIDEIGLEF